MFARHHRAPGALARRHGLALIRHDFKVLPAPPRPCGQRARTVCAPPTNTRSCPSTQRTRGDWARSGAGGSTSPREVLLRAASVGVAELSCCKRYLGFSTDNKVRKRVDGAPRSRTGHCGAVIATGAPCAMGGHQGASPTLPGAPRLWQPRCHCPAGRGPHGPYRRMGPERRRQPHIGLLGSEVS
jgi:hypothetical protein